MEYIEMLETLADKAFQNYVRLIQQSEEFMGNFETEEDFQQYVKQIVFFWKEGFMNAFSSLHSTMNFLLESSIEEDVQEIEDTIEDGESEA